MQNLESKKSSDERAHVHDEQTSDEPEPIVETTHAYIIWKKSKKWTKKTKGEVG